VPTLADSEYLKRGFFAGQPFLFQRLNFIHENPDLVLVLRLAAATRDAGV
jgi:hypothetical protein